MLRDLLERGRKINNHLVHDCYRIDADEQKRVQAEYMATLSAADREALHAWQTRHEVIGAAGVIAMPVKAPGPRKPGKAAEGKVLEFRKREAA